MITEYKRNCYSYDGKAKDISVESGSDAFTSEAEITDSNLDGSVDIQAATEKTEVCHTAQNI
jgi:hypothetical protein